MARHGKKYWDDELDDMKAYRVGRKYRWHKLSVAIGHNKLARENSDGRLTNRKLRPQI